VAPRSKTSLEVPQSLIKKIDANRDTLTREEFISLCIGDALQEEKVPVEEEHYITREEFEQYERRLDKPLLSFLEMIPSWEIDAWNKREKYQKLKEKLSPQLD